MKSRWRYAPNWKRAWKSCWRLNRGAKSAFVLGVRQQAQQIGAKAHGRAGRGIAKTVVLAKQAAEQAMARLPVDDTGEQHLHLGALRARHRSTRCHDLRHRGRRLADRALNAWLAQGP